MLGLALLVSAAVLLTGPPLTGEDRPRPRALNLEPPAISTDKTVKSLTGFTPSAPGVK